MTSSMNLCVVAVASVALALAGACPCIGGILAIALGSGQKGDLARVGVILGWIHIGMTAIIILIMGLFILVGGSAAAFG